MSIKVKGLLLVAFVAAIVISIVSTSSSSSIHIKQGQLELQKLEVANVESITLSPYSHSSSSLVSKAVLVKDSAAIRALVNYYKALTRYRPGQGRVFGDWEVEVTFLLANGKKLKSHVYHNDYASLVFIPTTEKNSFGGYDDLLADNPQQDIGKLLEKYR